MSSKKQGEEMRTIADLAKAAGCSAATVSRALNDSPLISTDTKERIQELARRHSFQMHAGAQALRRQRTQTLALVIWTERDVRTVAADPFALEMLGAVTTAASAQDYDVIFAPTTAEPEEWSARYLRSGRADGLILNAPHAGREAAVAQLAADGAPHVLWGPPPAALGHSVVGSDDKKGAVMATDHLVRLGRRRIAHLGGGSEFAEANLRYLGYSEVLTREGLPLDNRFVTHAPSTSRGGYEGMRRLLVQAPELDAVFVFSDIMAIGALEALREAGRAVPRDVAIVGFDDISLSAYASPPLTTVRQDLRLAGKLLVDTLLRSIDGEPPRSTVLPIELIVRRSCGALK